MVFHIYVNYFIPKKKTLCKEACWALSNICAGNTRQVQAIISADIIPRLVQLMRDDQPTEIRKEAGWAISNACSGGNKLQIKYIVSKGALNALCYLLDSSDNKSLLVALEGIDNILHAGEEDLRELGENRYSSMLEKLRGLDKIEELQNSEDGDIFEKSTKIIEDYYSFDTLIDDVPGDDISKFNITLPSSSQNSFIKFNFG